MRAVQSSASSGKSDGARRPAPVHPVMRLLRRASVPVLLLVLWEVVSDTGLVDSYFLPPPHRVLEAGWALLISGTLVADVAVSLYRLLSGYVIGAIAGVAVGVFIGWSKLANDLLDPLIQALRPVSPIALLPLAMVYLGIGDLEKIVLIAYSTFFPVVISTYFGVRGVDPVVIMAAKTLGANAAATCCARSSCRPPCRTSFPGCASVSASVSSSSSPPKWWRRAAASAFTLSTAEADFRTGRGLCWHRRDQPARAVLRRDLHAHPAARIADGIGRPDGDLRSGSRGMAWRVVLASVVARLLTRNGHGYSRRR